MPQGPQPSNSILVFTVPVGFMILVAQDARLVESKRNSTWVKRCDNDSWKLGRPIRCKHATTEFGVGVGGVGGEGGLRVEEGEGGRQGGRLGDRAGDDEAR